MKFLPSEACAYALAMLENSKSTDPLASYIFIEACDVLESADVTVRVERLFDDAPDYYAEVCSLFEYTNGRQAFALLGTHTTLRGALIFALQSLFD